MGNRAAVALFGPVWLAVGVWTGLQNGYALGTLTEAASFLLTTVLWPVVLWGQVDLHLGAG